MEGAGGGQVTLIFSFIFYLVRLWLGCIPRISFIIACLEVPQKFVWWLVVGGWLVESEYSDRLWLSSSLALYHKKVMSGRQLQLDL